MGDRYRALVYIRKSQVRHRRDEISPERQLENCLAAADAHGWTVDKGDIYRDAEGHRSGRSEKHRPAWRALKARIASDPTLAAVVVNSLDRSSRSPKDFFNFLDLIQKHSVELVSVKEQFDTSTAIGRAFLAILMIVASLESDQASERISDTIAYLKEQGVHWGRTPYGYTRDENAIPQADDHAPAVVAALEIYAEGGRGYVRVAQELNQHGYRWLDRHGQPVPFTRYSVRSIVSNILIYAGWVPYGRGKDMQITDKGRTLQELVVLSDAVPGQHPALIDEDLANRVLVVRHRRLAKAPRKTDHLFLLTPLLVCAHCGRPLRGKLDGRYTATPRYVHHTGGTCSPGRGAHDAQSLEKRILDLLDIRLEAEMIEDVRAMMNRRNQARPENQDLQRQLAARQAELARIRELYVLGDFERDEYLRRRDTKRGEIRALEMELGQDDYPLETALLRVQRMATILRAGSRPLQKRAIPTVFDNIAVGLDGEIKKVGLREWAQPFFLDLARLHYDDIRCPQGNSVARCVVVLAGLEDRLQDDLLKATPLPPLTQAPDTIYPVRPG